MMSNYCQIKPKSVNTHQDRYLATDGEQGQSSYLGGMALTG